MDSRNTRWPVFIADSDRKGGLGEPFGYLRCVCALDIEFNLSMYLHHYLRLPFTLF